MLLIYPPAAKPCEPPAGIAKLAGALRSRGIRYSVVDANLEGQLYLMNLTGARTGGAYDTWTGRAVRNLSRNLSALRDRKTYRSFDRYSRAVMDVNRALERAVLPNGITLSLANYQHKSLSPLRSSDLLRAAEQPELNPFYPYFRDRLRGLLERDNPSLVGFSLTYLNQALCAFAMLGFLRREYPALTLVCGGGLVTSWLRRPDRYIENHKPFAGLIDQLIEGPGEKALLALAGIPDEQEKHSTPNYDILPLNEYLSPGVILPYSGSSGCIWKRCSFCPERAEDNCYVPVGVEKAAADLSSLVDKHKPALIHLLDNSISPALMASLSDSPPGAPWYGFARIGQDLADSDFCISLKRSGCVMLKLGIESGDQDVLDRMQKGIDLETVSVVLKNLRRADISAYVYLLFGTPEETPAGARKTLEFTVRHSWEIGFLNLALFNMPAGAPEALTFRTTEFYNGDLSLYTDFAHPQGWDRKRVRQFIDIEFRRHPAISMILKKDPPVFTSNHAPFFVME